MVQPIPHEFSSLFDCTKGRTRITWSKKSTEKDQFLANRISPNEAPFNRRPQIHLSKHNSKSEHYRLSNLQHMKSFHLLAQGSFRFLHGTALILLWYRSFKTSYGPSERCPQPLSWMTNHAGVQLHITFQSVKSNCRINVTLLSSNYCRLRVSTSADSHAHGAIFPRNNSRYHVGMTPNSCCMYMNVRNAKI